MLTQGTHSHSRHLLDVIGSQSTYYETKYLTGHAFVSNDLKNTIDSVCDWSVAINNTGDLSAECDEAVARMHAEVGNINIYNVFGECVSGSVQEKAGREVLRAPRKDAPWAQVGSAGPNACIDSIAATAWINQPEVIEALHVVQQVGEKLKGGSALRSQEGGAE